MTKAALVLQGGGTRGAFTSGVLDVLMEEKIEFEYLIGTSAGALNGLDYVSGDIGRSRFVSVELVSDDTFLSFKNLIRTGTYFNFDYLFHEVPATVSPFNQKYFDENPMKFIVTTTSCETGKVVYFEKATCPCFYEAIAASASLQLVARPHIVEGKPYLDGGVVAGIPWRKALEDGYEKIVVVLTRQYGYRKKPLPKAYIALAKRMYKEYPEFLKSYSKMPEVYNQDIAELEELEKQGQAFLIYPEESLKVGHTEKRRSKLTEVYDKGVARGREMMPALKKFLGIADE